MEKSRFYLSVFVTVAALSMAACGDDGSGGGNNINDNTNDNTNDNNNNNDNSNNNNNVNVGPLEITQVNPADGDTDVFIDETIRLTFSRNLDPMTVDEVSVKVTTDGEDAVGRLVTDRQTILFTPAEFEPSAIYTLSVSTDVSDASGVTMDEEFTSTFTTGTTAKDGSDPMDDSALDLIRKPFIYTTRKQEYVLLGVDHSNVGKDLFVVDPLAFNEMTPEPTEPIPYSVEDSSLNTYDIKMAAVGNLDDDVYDEVVYLTQGYSSSTGRGGVGEVHIFDYDEGTGYSRETLTQDLALPGGAGWHQYGVATGNLDDDPWDEIAIAGVNEHGYARLWILDDKLGNHALLSSLDILGNSTGGSNWTGTDAVWVNIGNIRGDKEPQLVLTIKATGENDATVRIIDDLSVDWASLDAHSACQDVDAIPIHPSNPGEEQGAWSDVALADLDGDGLAELVCSRRDVMAHDDMHTPIADYCRVDYSTEVLKMGTNGFEPFSHFIYPPLVNENVPTCSGHIPRAFEVLPLDIDGDKRDELFVGGQLLKFDPDDPTNLSLMENSVSLYGSSTSNAPLHVTVGDVNGDDGEDIILLRRDGSLDVWGINRIQTGTDMEGNPIYEYNWEQIDDQDRNGPSNQQNGIVVAANLDMDCHVVSPERDPDASDPDTSVKKEVVFSNDRIVAVIGAPPCAEDIGQNTDACEMGLGYSTGSSTTTGTAFSVWAGISMGVEIEQVALVITVAKFAAKVAVSAEYSTESSYTRSIEQTIADFVGFGEELVVFYTVPQTRYTYTVSSHPDASLVGTEIHVNVPMAPRMFAVTREFYNNNNSGQPDIDEDILSAVPGDLSTYPTYAEAQNTLDNNESLGITTPVAVNQGTGYKALELVVSEEYTESESVTIATEAEIEFCGATICVGASFGVSGSLYSESSYSTSTAFMSSVGALDDEHWAEYLYDFGLFAYLHQSDTLNQTFTIVNSYVD